METDPSHVLGQEQRLASESETCDWRLAEGLYQNEGLPRGSRFTACSNYPEDAVLQRPHDGISPQPCIGLEIC